MNLVVAVDREWGIGNKGDLLARVRGDLRNFAGLTSGKVVVYGSKTLRTFPGGRPLKNRVNVVLSRNPELEIPGALTAHSAEEVLSLTREYESGDVFVIGGAQIYSLLLPYCDCGYVTKFEKSFEKDAFFEDLDKSGEWALAYRGPLQKTCEETDSEKDMCYYFTKYRRIRHG